MTTLSKTFVAAAVVSLVVSASPSYAQRRNGGRGPGRARVAAVPRAVAPRAIGPRIAVRGGYNRPYYSPRPGFSLSFGWWSGFPVEYPYYYGYYDSPYYYSPYAYASPYRYYYPSYGYVYRPPVYRVYPRRLR